MYYFSIGAIFKNEAHILEEWLQHYIYHGVEHFYLINDGSTDNYMPILDKYKDYITLFDNDILHEAPGRQEIIYNTYIYPKKNESKWIAILDLDEFLYCPDGIIDIKYILKQREQYSEIKVNWYNFGSNNHEYQPLSVIEGFTRRAPCQEGTKWYSYKGIVLTQNLQSFGIHNHTTTGQVYHEQEKLRINHYSLQSLEWYLRVKGNRGDVNRWYDNNNLKRNKELFEEYDNNEIEDLLLYEQNKMIIPSIKELKINQLNNNVTVVLTSCNRPLLLEKTLDFFVKMNTYPITDFYIIDDSGKIGCNDEVIKEYSKILPIKHIYNKKNIGQVESIDKVYSYVTTKWIFHCEEDWKFLQPGFIEKSMKVFEENPNEKIYTVWLRPHNSTSDHPIVKDNLNRGYYEMQKDYQYLHHSEKMIWCGVTFNPGLRKTIDCLKWHPYMFHCNKSVINNREYVGEYSINSKYRDDGYYAMILADPNGHVDHIGWGQHIPREWD